YATTPTSSSSLSLHDALPISLGLVAYTGTARLKGFAVRAGRDFAKFIARGKPDFEVIGFRGGKTHVTGREQNGAIVQAEFLENGFGVAYEGFVLFIAFFRMGELEQLDLLELMLAEDAAGVFSSGAGFGA